MSKISTYQHILDELQTAIDEAEELILDAYAFKLAHKKDKESNPIVGVEDIYDNNIYTELQRKVRDLYVDVSNLKRLDS